MPSVIFSNMHPRVFDAFCLLFNAIGWKVYIPDPKEKNYFRYGACNTPSKGEYTTLTYKEFLDVKPDVVLCLCWQTLPASLELSEAVGAKLVVRAGNNSVPYNRSHSEFLLSNDLHTYKTCNIRNKLFFYLPPDYDFYTKQSWAPDSRIVPSYIEFYPNYWQQSWNIYNGILTTNKDITFINFGGVRDAPYSIRIVRPADIVRTLGISRCMLHVKEKEGYGWSMLEAISCGIPVIASKQFITGKTCEHFLVEGKTAVLLHKDIKEFRKAFDNVDLLHQISENGRKFLMDFIQPAEQYAKVKEFMENIVL